MTRRITTTALAVSGAALLAIGGCGVSNEGAIRELEQNGGAQGTTQTAAVKRANAALPQPTPGEVRVDGAATGTLTPLAAQAYRAAGGSSNLTVDKNGEDAGFAALCGGTADVVDSSRPITREELAKCRAAGLTPVQFTVAADAVVLATKGATDVGVDCLPVGQVREVYRAGSPIYDWSQLGYADAPLEVGGPSPDSEAFAFFGRTVLDAPQPSLTDLRSDYHAAQSDRENRLFVTGNAADATVASQRDLVAARLEAQQERLTKAKASRAAAQAELIEARKDQRKGVRDKRGAEAQAKARARVRAAELALSRANAYVSSASAAVAAGQKATAAAGAATRRQSQLRGRLSYFRFSYYELYEEELRPLEISEGSGEARNCVFPSQNTVTDGSYPLARQLLLTTTTAGLARGEVKGFLSAYLRRATQLAITQHLVPLPQARVREQLGWLTGERRPTIVVDPSAPGAPSEVS